MIRPAALASDILLCFYIALPVDFISGGIYKPSKDTSKQARAKALVRTKKDSALMQNHITISTDITQYILFQPNFGIEYRLKHIEFGANVGLVYPIAGDNVNVLANGQYTMPAPVYYGQALRLCSKYYNSTSAYWCFQTVIKRLWYNQVNFYDNPGGDEGTQINYTMNEKTTVLGFEILRGYLVRLPYGIQLDMFFGLGYHERFRLYTITKSDNPFGPYIPGTYKDDVGYPTPVVGIKFGFGFYHKKGPS